MHFQVEVAAKLIAFIKHMPQKNTKSSATV